MYGGMEASADVRQSAEASIPEPQGSRVKDQVIEVCLDMRGICAGALYNFQRRQLEVFWLITSAFRNGGFSQPSAKSLHSTIKENHRLIEVMVGRMNAAWRKTYEDKIDIPEMCSRLDTCVAGCIGFPSAICYGSIGGCRIAAITRIARGDA